jgi:hypothetical protein
MRSSFLGRSTHKYLRKKIILYFYELYTIFYGILMFAMIFGIKRNSKIK